MSTPPRRPIDPSDLSDYVPRQTRERFGAERHPRENDPPPAPHAPSPAYERADAEQRPGRAVDPDAFRSPYAPKPARARVAPEAGGVSAPGNTEALSTAAPPRFAHPHSDRHTQPAAHSHQDENIDQSDLERLETSLRWLQRQEADRRFAHAAQPAPALARREAVAPRRSHLTWLLPTLLVIGIAGPVLYYFSAEGWKSALETARPPRLVALKERFDIPRPIGQEEVSPINSRDDPRASVAHPSSFRQATAIPVGPSSAGKAVTLRQPDAIGAEPAPPSRPISRVLDPEQIALLVKQGEQFVSAGDLAAARTVFQRAAEAGNATAAVALGATYDPTVLKKLGVIGMRSDVEKARSWYEKAESLGSAEATQRLRILATH
jgi:hypothetical protein